MKRANIAALLEDVKLYDVLTAIGVVSMHLMRKLKMLINQGQMKEGVKSYGKKQQTGYGHQ